MNVLKDYLIESTAYNISPFNKEPQPAGNLVRFWTPEGYMAGIVKGSRGPDQYLIELASDDLGRLVEIVYCYSSLGYGPHWDVNPHYDSYKVGTRADWDRLDDIFSHGWKAGAVIA